ncbi:ABC transporter ATP-binding protein [Marinomonas aquiplantarum]|uniref:Amino acid/amide ABC transporter ATP-binding protein 1 (HAAT family) n=1 Tax=Marinomonas aquiplantarum TaxID=491951 RepID=A0A366CVD7_9GAMM|nr:ABC transporter ATP-binding protein [Marinomonas aquiplantarum]RBO80038.1 amino acid/amide ABC transporter ATP-binding protein 1 (HAAT family) [Marinomonas aquiplantarum]
MILTPYSQLQATGIHKSFGSVQVLNGIDFSMDTNDAIGIVGPNGAGKSTLLSVLSGAQAPTSGQITLNNKDITRIPARERAKQGLVRTHQIPKPFSGITVFENVFVAAIHSATSSRETAYDIALESIKLCGMLPLANREADSIGLLDRKRLELARALATQPKLLFLDEIGGGLTDAEALQLVDTILTLRERGIGIVWIEHIVHILLRVVKTLICMDSGQIIAQGHPDDVMSNKQVMKAYMGGTDHAVGE